MSKAFKKEGGPVEEDLEDESPRVPTGQKNYITPGGFARLQEQLHHLRHVERPEVCAVVSWAAENGDRSENADYQYGKRKLRQIDSKIRFLSKRLDSVVVVNPLEIPNKTQVFFGATVVVREDGGDEKTYKIVGIDESDLAADKISWISPLATALFKAQEGDVVEFRSPKGQREIEIVSIRYEAIS